MVSARACVSACLCLSQVGGGADMQQFFTYKGALPFVQLEWKPTT